MTDPKITINGFLSAEADLRPPICPGGPRRMVISTRPQDWAEPARRWLFGDRPDLRSGYGGHRV